MLTEPNMRAVMLQAVPQNHPMKPMVGAVETALATAGYDLVDTFDLTATPLAFCQGEFDCWVKTPGVCRAADGQTDIVAAAHDADAVVLLGPVVFGGHGSVMKRSLDRFLCLLEPFFEKRAELTHHHPRYARQQRFFSIGAASGPAPELVRTFADLNDANALNYLAPECGAVVLDVARPGQWAQALADMFAKPHAPGADISDRSTLRQALLAAAQATVPTAGPAVHRVALLVGSPKVKGTSASEVMARALASRLERASVATELHWATEFVHDGPSAQQSAAAIAACDVFVLVTPLYVDALPSLTTQALELVARVRQTSRAPASFATVINCGFPEPEQNRTALRIARHFADQAGYRWGGALPIGGGGVVTPERNLEVPNGPVTHLVRGLDLAALALAANGTIPDDAIAEVTHASMPDFLYRAAGDLGWRWQARQNGLKQRELHVRPLDGA